jgi:hypothetical protein
MMTESTEMRNEIFMAYFEVLCSHSQEGSEKKHKTLSLDSSSAAGINIKISKICIKCRPSWYKTSELCMYQQTNNFHLQLDAVRKTISFFDCGEMKSGDGMLLEELLFCNSGPMISKACSSYNILQVTF